MFLVALSSEAQVPLTVLLGQYKACDNFFSLKDSKCNAITLVKYFLGYLVLSSFLSQAQIHRRG